jgi:hypothetical protein
MRLKSTLSTLLTASLAVGGLAAGTAAAAAADTLGDQLPVCSPSGLALSFSDGLDKQTFDGARIGGLSSLAFDPTSGDWASAVDNNGSDPARIWFFRGLTDPQIARAPLMLKMPDGTPYNGMNSDNEGLAVLPDGDFVVSSETEPSIRIYNRDGLQIQSLPIPARFAVTGTTRAGQATSNATLEGLTITPDGHTIVAAMEGALSGDVSSTGDATAHRMLVFNDSASGWKLSKQIGYRADEGQRIPEVLAYLNGSLLVEEASFSATTGNAVSLYAFRGLHRARDVSRIRNLSTAPAGAFVRKTLVANLADCPTLGAPALETQANPLLDNFEGMALTSSQPFLGLQGVTMISDDNFSAQQHTRLLNLALSLPGDRGH